MKRYTLPLLVVVLWAVTVSGQTGQDDSAASRAQVSISELHIVAERHGDLVHHSVYRGTRLYLRVEIPGATITGLNEAKCELKKFEGDKETELMIEHEWEPGWAITATPQGVSESGEYVRVIIRSEAVPERGATWIRAAGTLAISIAGEKQSVENETPKLQEGDILEAGPLTLVTDYILPTEEGKLEPDVGGWGPGRRTRSYTIPNKGEMIVEFKVMGDTSAYADIEFFDEQGEEIECLRRGWGENDGLRMWTYALDGRARIAKARLSYWADKKDVMVPFDITTGLGLVDLTKPADADFAE